MAVHTVDRLEDVPDPAPDATFVVVDVIISSTSIVRLLEEGARYVRPFADADAARAFEAETEGAVLVGEQGGQPVDGFDCSPLPSLIAERDFTDRPVGILTSNGTRAVHRIGDDADVLIGSTVNAAAVADHLRERHDDVWLVAAGRQGDRTPEDSAGVELIRHHHTDQATNFTPDDLATQVRESGTAEWLQGLGFENEVEDLCTFDTSSVVPTLRDGRFVD
ncbi:2-phosphosulfolactate phosphatase [Halorientalis regularis]|uniref:2-phosphosulfolactate phosphatase n=1 Tax=Halorientalis regularis TaxID=660518 RepID=A0A1G7GSP9_9EURY|nr:2-phosphosulfolactate phosphatase [Halorientalis regularis]SDE91177.1 Phosphosulfolactate phosphohydrolase [Halorientalis regularis]